MEFFFIVLAFAGGGVLSCQQVMNAALGHRIGSLSSSFVNHLVGALFAGVLLVVGMKTGPFHLQGVPVVYLLGGCLGLLTVAMSNFAIPHIGVVLFSVLATSLQLGASSCIDHFGWLGTHAIPFDFAKAAGIILLIFGAVLVFVKEKSKTLPAIEQITL